MKPMRYLLFPLSAVLLAGCGQKPLYTAHYYQTHKAALQKELKQCKKAETLTGNAKKNCEMAKRVAGDEFVQKSLFSGFNNNPSLLP